MQLWEHTATALAELVTTRQASAPEVLDSFLQRIERVDGVISAYCTLDPDGARAQAREVQLRVDAGEDLPLAGVPVGIKDLLDTEGLRTTYGSLAYTEHVPVEDDIAVRRLRDAGAVVVGKTNTSEFGYGAHGRNRLFEQTRNPWDVRLTSGGSSAGSAAAVASGMAALALGSDGGGSVRIPAALCGLVGIKASMGRVPCWPSTKDDRLPGASSWESLEHIGPLARSVDDAATALRVMAGPDPRDRLSQPGRLVLAADGALERLQGLRVGFSPDLGYGVVEPGLVDSARASALALASACGTSLVELDVVIPDPTGYYEAMIARDSDLVGMRALAEGGELSSYVISFLARGWTAEQLTSAGRARQTMTRAMVELMTQVDLVLTPTLWTAAHELTADGPAPTPQGEDRSAWISLCWPANLTGQPAASVPAAAVAGMPAGVQVIGGHLQDELVVDACRVLELVTPWSDRRPSL